MKFYLLNQNQAFKNLFFTNTRSETLPPNPGSSNFELEYAIPGKESWQLIVADITGRVLLQTGLSAQHYTIDARDWASGVYLYHLTANGKTLYNGKLIKL